jgi:hypothetical protein
MVKVLVLLSMWSDFRFLTHAYEENWKFHINIMVTQKKLNNFLKKFRMFHFQNSTLNIQTKSFEK